MRRLYTLLILIICSVQVWAQQQVSGTVSDAKGALPGVTIFEKGMPQNGAMADNDGRFKITLKGTSGTLVFSFVGYLTKEVRVTGSNLNVTLAADAKGLEEVVIVGYGTQKKITNTGAVSAISGKDIRQTPSASLQNTLMGRVPSITTQQQSGRPGADGASIRIRGISTYGEGGGNPLIIVDDVEYPGPISEIDADQVETISVLKDAATTSVYGVKGANGVILITTRRGKAGGAKMTLRSELGFQVPTKLPQYLDSYESARLTNVALVGDGGTPRFTNADLEAFRTGSDPYGHPNIDWLKELLRPNTIQSRTNLNIQGGTEKMKYFIAGAYLYQNGVVKDFGSPDDIQNNYYYKRYNFRSNIDVQLTKTLLLNFDLSGNFGEQNVPHSLGKNGAFTNNIFLEIKDYTSLPPFAYQIYNPDGSYSYNPAYPTSIVGRLATGGYERDYNTDILSNIKLTQKLDFITKGLSVRALIAYNSRYGYARDLTRTYFPSYIYNPATGKYTPYNNGSAYVTRLENLSLAYSANANAYKRLNTQFSLNYDNRFGDHRIYGLALFNQYSNVPTRATSTTTYLDVPINFRGATGRIGYDYKQRYLLEFNGAYNGSSQFPSNSRFGFFPSVSAGWNIAEESFMKNSKALDFIGLLKLRGSYGLVGSDAFTVSGDYAYLQTYPRSGSANIGETPNAVTPIVEGPAGSDITWEKERQLNIGIDMTLFDNKLNITADVFNRNRYDILTTRRDIPALFGNTTNAVNIGRVRNRGFEVDARYNGKAGKVNYFVSANISVAKNKILYQSEPNPAYPWLSLTGYPVGSILGYNWIGYYQSADEIANPSVPKPVSSVVVKPGDLKYADLNGDGIIDVNDRTVLQYPNLPNTILGMTFGFTYRNFSFSSTLQSGLNYSLQGGSAEVNPFQNNFRKLHLDYWTPENTNPSYPRLTAVSNSLNNALSYVSDYWYRRSDYLRLKTAEISYSLPTALIKKLHVLEGARIYANGYNLFTVALKGKSKFDIDPESVSGTGNEGTYPQQKIYNLGIQLSF
ncbi:TonB-dependent receptor [Mucilaginibacter sp. PAMB04274]|uniref:SusC/RagA family TonB-linked outer membrane protein n=1 Tax=Mucilaginibacter sp. PAMB04274 TaxID=3138568 RepID=UPI0031F6FFAC